MKFKKHISLFLAFFLLVSNVGLAFNVHYCGDEIDSVSLKPSFVDNDSEENCCGVVEKISKCCKDKVIVIQKNTHDATIKYFSVQFDYHFLVQDFYCFNFTFPQFFNKTILNSYYCDANAPPLFKLYSQYIFYA